MRFKSYNFPHGDCCFGVKFQINRFPNKVFYTFQLDIYKRVIGFRITRFINEI